jgi:hypothetical protein
VLARERAHFVSIREGKSQRIMGMINTKSLLERSRRIELEGLDLGAFEQHPLGAEPLRCLRYMCDVESHTVCYLREMLVTRAHRDPEITAFLSCWVYEEYWHGEVLGHILALHGMEESSDMARTIRMSRAKLDNVRLLGFALGSALGEGMIALFMAWGALNEWTTQAGYARLSKLAHHPVLGDVLGRIMRQEGRHIDFYSSQASHRLESRPVVQKFVRMTLKTLWAPVGSGLMPGSETAFMSRWLFGGRDGMEAVRRVDRQLSRLPGLEGLHLLERAVSKACAERPASGPREQFNGFSVTESLDARAA